MDGENSWRGKSVSREKIAKFENEILLHKGQFIFILLRSLSPRVPSSSSKSSFFYALFSLSIFIYNPLCVLMARKKGTSGGRSKRRKANLRWKNVFVHFVCVPEKPLFASVCLIEWNIFVTIVVCFLCHGSMHNTSSWDPSRAKCSICPEGAWVAWREKKRTSKHTFPSNLISCRKILFMLLVIFYFMWKKGGGSCVGTNIPS